MKGVSVYKNEDAPVLLKTLFSARRTQRSKAGVAATIPFGSRTLRLPFTGQELPF
jgi:hypothetical protein